MTYDRFISFKDIQGIEHTVRITDIEAVGIGTPDGRTASFIRYSDFPFTVSYTEAARVKQRWMEEG